MNNSYKLKNDKNDPSLKYFADHPVSEWSFADFEASFNKGKPKPANVAKIQNIYLSIMKNIQRLSNVPDFMKAKTCRLVSSIESPQIEPQNISFSITTHGSSVINALGSGTFNSNQQQQSTETVQQQEEDIESTLDLEHFCNEESNEEDKIPFNLSIHHHPHRTCEYTLTFTDSVEEKEEEEEGDATEFENTLDESEWMLDGVCISDLCFDLKNVTLKLAKRTDPAQLSDIRLLALNDIYIFDRNFTSSVSKYFSTKVHTLLKPTLSFDAYLPTRVLNCYDWCMDIKVSPPADWISSLSLCA